MGIRNIISDLRIGFIAGLLFTTILLNNNTGFTIIDCIHLSRISNENNQKILAANSVEWKYGFVNKKQASFRSFIKAHKTKRKRPQSFLRSRIEESLNEREEFVVHIIFPESSFHSYLLSTFQFRGPPSLSC